MIAARMKRKGSFKGSKYRSKCFMEESSNHQAHLSGKPSVAASQNVPKYFKCYAGCTEKDIMCEKGKLALEHPGNKVFSTLVRAFRDQYHQCTLRSDKTKTTATVIDRCHQNGARFIKYDHQARQWYEVDYECAHEKVSHALRQSTKSLSSQKAQKCHLTKKKKPSDDENQFFLEVYGHQQNLLTQGLKSQNEKLRAH